MAIGQKIKSTPKQLAVGRRRTIVTRPKPLVPPRFLVYAKPVEPTKREQPKSPVRGGCSSQMINGCYSSTHQTIVLVFSLGFRWFFLGANCRSRGHLLGQASSSIANISGVVLLEGYTPHHFLSRRSSVSPKHVLKWLCFKRSWNGWLSIEMTVFMKRL